MKHTNKEQHKHNNNNNLSLSLSLSLDSYDTYDSGLRVRVYSKTRFLLAAMIRVVACYTGLSHPFLRHSCHSSHDNLKRDCNLTHRQYAYELSCLCLLGVLLSRF